MRTIGGLVRPQSGAVVVDGEDVTTLSEIELYRVRKKLGMMFQQGALLDSLTVFDNLAFPLREQRTLSEEEIPARIGELLAAVKLPGIEALVPAELSGGMRKRVALARALALEPELLLFDEPTTGLDPISSASIAHLILDTRRETGCASIVVTHDLPLARRVSDRIAFLDRGRFRFVGTFDEAERAADPLLGAFLAGREETADVAETT
jgi:phospholipid/cholesterol/gamma-HCH transport system ATP-binding protein